MERKGIIAAGNMLVDHVHQIVQWPERGWLAEIIHSERATGGAPLNVLLTLAKMHVGLPLQAVGLIGEDSDGDYIMAMLDQYHVNRQRVQRTTFAPTSMSQVMTDPTGQRTFFHSPAANRLLDLPAFDRLDASMKIFHLGYLLLLDSLDLPDDEFGTRSARLLAQMREQGYETSLDLVSRKGDPRYQPLVLPALRYVDYLVINELEAGEFSGLDMRNGDDAPDIDHIALAASQLLAAGVKQRVVIHCPEGAWGEAPGEPGQWIASKQLEQEEIIGSVGAGDAFCAGFLYGCHEAWPLTDSIQLAHACARASLLAANAIDGAKTLEELKTLIHDNA
ncbi:MULTISPECIES: carbohydrate kinase family protein [Lelliottia]|jgi:sugar/nucleoside kinase (ribokinase family)|uniref:carbohydrate kinase family protein n=1 Tax=Lelliottia TaxID=1330545 RepID=UPI0007435157|nr:MULTISPECIES: carbohydrate kinase family protein [Lelliottia]ATG03451.1 carbohydrate kinase family protein [Lelliottia amnigena]MCU7784687.1 carbohydrate kinase family protein [Lelliottia amnigena]PEG65612.1 carbohydrate kinase family protein [Lelliottia amnigena]QXA23718.1 carbohydrate kinase family protein [Lelliottia amnigena]CAI9417278.1 putative sugar kinase YdjH [Lelliottia sp. T2.26D-8]